MPISAFYTVTYTNISGETFVFSHYESENGARARWLNLKCRSNVLDAAIYSGGISGVRIA